VAIIPFFPQEKLEQREINIQMDSRRFSEGIFFLLMCDHKLKKTETWGLLHEQEMKLKVFLDSYKSASLRNLVASRTDFSLLRTELGRE
jgi:hypothetical protein